MLTALSSAGRGACGEPEWPLGRTGEGKQPTVAPGGAGARRGSGSGDSLQGQAFHSMAPGSPSSGVQTPGRGVGLGLGFCWTVLAEGQGHKALEDVGEAATWDELQLSSRPDLGRKGSQNTAR